MGVYKGATMSELNAPKTIFIPTSKILRRIIRAIVMFREEPREALFMRFGLLDNHYQHVWSKEE